MARSVPAAVRRLASPADALLLAAAPVALLVVFALPVEVRLGLAFRPADPSLPTALAASYVHLGAGHLGANLIAYLLLAPTTYLLCLLSGRRALFLAALPAFLVAVPLVLSGLQLAGGGGAAAVGFSGVNAAVFGLFAFALSEYAGARITRWNPARGGPALFFLGLAAVAAVAVPDGFRSLGLATAAVLSGLLYVDGSVDRADLTAVADDLRVAAAAPGYLELGVAAACLYVAYPFVAFPADPAAAGGVVNVYAHLLGFSLAFIGTYVAAEVADWEGAGRAAPA